AAEITRRLRDSRALSDIDAQRMQSSFERYRALDQQKKQLIRDAILHRWGTRQRERLLASTGSRLNSRGAELKRRLTTRGERAMRLRQVIAVGLTPAEAEDESPQEQSEQQPEHDSLFDLRPIWMASPET